MTTPRLRVQIELDAPCGAKQTADDIRAITADIEEIVHASLQHRITIFVGEDMETLDFTTPKVTVRQTKATKKRGGR